MNHNFTPKNLTPNLCATCNRPIMDHSKVAHCEACDYIGPCDIDKVLTNNMLLCPACKAKEIAANTNATHNANETVKSYGDFFNARVTPIVQVKELFELNGKSFADFHEHIKSQIEHFSRVLFETQIVTSEDTVSKLLIDFRAEVRTRLKESDINYQPLTKAPKVNVRSAIKKSPLDRMAEMVVAAEGKKGNVISLVDAKRKLSSEMGLKE